MQLYRGLLDGDVDAHRDHLGSDMAICAEADASQVPAMLCTLTWSAPELVLDNPKVVQWCVVAICEPKFLFSLCSQLLCGEVQLFGADAATVVAASLAWEAYEQQYLWQLMGSQAIGDLPAQTGFVIGVLPLLDSEQTHPEALSGLAHLLRAVPPNEELLAALLQLQPEGSPQRGPADSLRPSVDVR